jgi:hypothetical protein
MTTHGTDDAVAAAVHRYFGCGLSSVIHPLEFYSAGRFWLFHVSIWVVSRGGSTPEAMEIFNEDKL